MGGGGGGGGHHGQKWVPPDWRGYKVEGVPKLEAHVQRLAALGLKDPWVRNEVWRYHPQHYKPVGGHVLWLLTRGAPYGIAAFGAAVLYDLVSSRFRRGSEDEHHH